MKFPPFPPFPTRSTYLSLGTLSPLWQSQFKWPNLKDPKPHCGWHVGRARISVCRGCPLFLNQLDCQVSATGFFPMAGGTRVPLERRALGASQQQCVSDDFFLLKNLRGFHRQRVIAFVPTPLVTTRPGRSSYQQGAACTQVRAPFRSPSGRHRKPVHIRIAIKSKKER